MTAHEARFLVHADLTHRGFGVAVVDIRAGARARGHLVAIPESGPMLAVKVAVGKRGRKDGDALYVDRRRVGTADVVAVVDSASGAVEYRNALAASEGRNVPYPLSVMRKPRRFAQAPVSGAETRGLVGVPA